MGLNYACDPGTSLIIEAASGAGHASNLFCRKPVAEDLGPHCPNDGVGKPIDPKTGVEFLTETDYEGPDGLIFQRTYRSSLGYFASVLSSGLALPQGAAGSSAAVVVGDGCYPGVYRDPATGQYRPYCFPLLGVRDSTGSALTALLMIPAGRVLPLNTGGATPVVTTNPGVQVRLNPDPADPAWRWEFLWEDDRHERYDANGRLVLSWPRLGPHWATSYSYSEAATSPTVAPRPGLLIAITNASGRRLAFTYDGDGRMVEMTDPTGGVYQYIYDADGNLAAVTYPDGKRRRYLYHETAQLPGGTATPGYPHLLTGVVDENGVRYASIRYDASGRGSETSLIGRVGDVEGQPVERYQLSYPQLPPAISGSGLTRIIDPLGQSHDYGYQLDALGVTRPTRFSRPAGQGCGPASAATSYDAAGHPVDHQDFNGHITHTQWDLARSLTTVPADGCARKPRTGSSPLWPTTPAAG